ncbi:hypothetical protein JST97_20775 [bacterium]|nr:hypothetical protein [bacterium]
MKRAFTLTEVLILTALLGLLAVLMATFLSRVFRFGYVNLRENARLQRAQVLYSHLLRDLRSTTSAGVSWQPELKALAIQPLQTISNSGRPVYSDHRLIVYVGDTGLQRVRRKQFEQLSLQAEEPRRVSRVEMERLMELPAAGQENYTEILEFDLGSSLSAENISSPLHPRLAILYDRVYGQPQQVRVELKQELYLPSCP